LGSSRESTTVAVIGQTQWTDKLPSPETVNIIKSDFGQLTPVCKMTFFHVISLTASLGKFYEGTLPITPLSC